MWRWVLSAALVGIAPGAVTADVYSYTQENGTLAFTDDPERVPQRYQSEAVHSPDRPLEDYERLTIRLAPHPRRAAPVEAMPETLAAPPAAPAATGGPAFIEAAPGLLIPATPAAGTEPIRVLREFRWIDGRYTPVWIVRRGDEILAISQDPRS